MIIGSRPPKVPYRDRNRQSRVTIAAAKDYKSFVDLHGATECERALVRQARLDRLSKDGYRSHPERCALRRRTNLCQSAAGRRAGTNSTRPVMKCRACWSDKAYVRTVRGWRRAALSTFLLVPLKCHHCYHKFSVPWVFTWGKQLTPPPLRVAPETAGTQPAAGRHHEHARPVLYTAETARKVA